MLIPSLFLKSRGISEDPSFHHLPWFFPLFLRFFDPQNPFGSDFFSFPPPFALPRSRKLPPTEIGLILGVDRHQNCSSCMKEIPDFLVTSLKKFFPGPPAFEIAFISSFSFDYIQFGLPPLIAFVVPKPSPPRLSFLPPDAQTTTEFFFCSTHKRRISLPLWDLSSLVFVPRR